MTFLGLGLLSFLLLMGYSFLAIIPREDEEG